jgi:hypothetical protein
VALLVVNEKVALLKGPLVEAIPVIDCPQGAVPARMSAW